MTTSHYVDRRAIEQQLREVVLDANCTPDRKLPNCPLCGDDELYGWRGAGGHGFRCYRCSYRFTIEAPTPQPSKSARVSAAEFVRAAVDEAARSDLCEKALSVLINRAGGTLVLSEAELIKEHGDEVSISVDRASRLITFSSTPCPQCAKRRAEVGQA